MLIEIDNYPEEKKVEVRVIHACVILENGLPFYQENKTTFPNARIVNGTSGTMAVVHSKAFDRGEKADVKNEDILMVIPAAMTVMRNHYPERNYIPAPEEAEHPF